MLWYTQLNNVISGAINWNNKERAPFFALLHTAQFQAGEYLVKKGEPSNNIFFINQGLSGNILEDQEGNRFPVHFSFQDDHTSSLAGFLNDKTGVSDLVALEDLDCVVIPRTALQWMYDNVKEGNKFGRIQQERILSLLVKRQRLNYIKDPLQRFRYLQQIYPGIEKRISQRFISSILKIDPAHFSRLKAAAEKNDL